MLSGAVRFLFLLVTKLAVVHHATDWRLSIRRNFNQIEIKLLDLLKRLVQRNHPDLLPFGSDDTHFTGTNLMIDSGFPSYRTPPFG